MKKDIEWLKKELDEIVEFDLDHRFGIMSDQYVSLNKLINLIDQLVEPEKPVVPKMVGEYIEKERGKNTLGNIAESIYNSDECWSHLSDAYRWIRLNFTLFSKAWLDGYEIEKEPQWIVFQGGISKIYLKSFGIYQEKNNNCEFNFDKASAIKFTDKSKAEAVALLTVGTVEELSE